jgi:hypothetical protein
LRGVATNLKATTLTYLAIVINRAYAKPDKGFSPVGKKKRIVLYNLNHKSGRAIKDQHDLVFDIAKQAKVGI